jgi:hypothetical protein
MTTTVTTATATGKTAERKKRKRTTMQPCWRREEREAER